MYIYHALINALSAHMMHSNLNLTLYTHVEHSPTKTIYIKYYMYIYIYIMKMKYTLQRTSTNTHTHTDYASVVWNRCSDLLKKILNSLHRRAVKLIFPDTTLTTDQK